MRIIWKLYGRIDVSRDKINLKRYRKGKTLDKKDHIFWYILKNPMCYVNTHSTLHLKSVVILIVI